MNVSDAINTRLTARAFLDKPVDGALVRQILETAKRAPSGGNLQPWRVWVLGGEEMVRFKLLMKDKISANPRGEGTGRAEGAVQVTPLQGWRGHVRHDRRYARRQVRKAFAVFPELRVLRGTVRDVLRD
jgi:nitroreductase